MNFEFEATGTIWRITAESNHLPGLEEVVKTRLNDFEQTYSRFLDASFVSKISNITGEFTLPKDAQPLFDLYFDLYRQTDGLFTPLIGQNLIESGYDKNYSLVSRKLSPLPDLLDVVEYDFPKLKIKTPVQFDFGGVGKGYLIDIVAELLKKNEVQSFTIDAGGDIFHQGELIEIGLEHPLNKNQVIGKISMDYGCLCASSGNRRNWGKFHHILDPKRQESPVNILATWVLADKAILADSLATCLFLIPPEKLKRYYNFEYLILYPDFSIDKSGEFHAEIYLV